jgi:hypothetical protein
VCNREGGGGEGISLFGEHIQDLYTVYEPSKLLYYPKQKPRRGGVLDR